MWSKSFCPKYIAHMIVSYYYIIIPVYFSLKIYAALVW